MEQFSVQENTIRLFILAYNYWSFQDFVGATKETPLGLKLEKVFGKRFGKRVVPTEDSNVKKEYGKYKPSKAAFALFPGRFEYQYNEHRVNFMAFLQNFYLFSSREPWEILNPINYKKEYNKLCEFFKNNITNGEINFLEDGEDSDWWEDPDYSAKFLYRYINDVAA